LLSQVSALSDQSDSVAADTILRTAQENADAAKRFLETLVSDPDKAWQGLSPIHAHLLSGGAGGRRDWSNIAAKGFVDAYFKDKREEEEAAAQAKMVEDLAINGIAFIAMLSPAAPLAAAVLAASEAYNVVSALGSVAASQAAQQKADILGKGAAVGVSDRDEARRAKEDADSKQTGMVFDVITSALPYLSGALRGAAKAAGALGREAKWAALARTATEIKDAEGLRAAVAADANVADNAVKEYRGIPDARVGSETHELKYGELGPERCSVPHCMLFGQSLSDRGKFVQDTAGATERVKQRAMYLQARGDSISARGAAIAKLPKAARAAQEGALLREAYGIELQMVEIEHEAMGVTSDFLPAGWKGKWGKDGLGTPGEGTLVPESRTPRVQILRRQWYSVPQWFSEFYRAPPERGRS
ncbi:MAG: hypothetical protein WA869_21130, partial [Alloacidobacterium sp.]